MELRNISMADLPLYEAMMTDPVMMAELGGPLPREGLSEKLRGIVEDVRAGTVWYLAIVPDERLDEAAGTVCVWEHLEDGDPINEIGWMVQASSQGRGLATEAVRSVLRRARSEPRWGVIHAFPGRTNAPSNAICRKTGFSMLEPREIEYAGRTLRCNHWRIDLAAEARHDG